MENEELVVMKLQPRSYTGHVVTVENTDKEHEDLQEVYRVCIQLFQAMQ